MLPDPNTSTHHQNAKQNIPLLVLILSTTVGGQGTGPGTRGIPQLRQGLCLGLSSPAMGIRLNKRCRCMFGWLCDALKQTWNTEVFWAGGSSLVCERSNLTFGLLHYLTHSGEHYSCIRPSKWLAQSKPRARQCLSRTQVFSFPCTLKYRLSVLQSACKMCRWNRMLFLQWAVAAALTQLTAWLQVWASCEADCSTPNREHTRAVAANFILQGMSCKSLYWNNLFPF